MANLAEIEPRVRAFILKEFLPEEDPTQFTSATPLVTSGILDSLAMLKLVGYLEKEFAVVLEAHEVAAENFDNTETIAGLIAAKLG